MQKFSLTELTDRLQAPDSAQLQQELIGQLMNLHEKVDSRIKGGARPDEFDDYENIRSAVTCAINVLNHYMQ